MEKHHYPLCEELCSGKIGSGFTIAQLEFLQNKVENPYDMSIENYDHFYFDTSEHASNKSFNKLLEFLKEQQVLEFSRDPKSSIGEYKIYWINCGEYNITIDFTKLGLIIDFHKENEYKKKKFCEMYSTIHSLYYGKSNLNLPHDWNALLKSLGIGNPNQFLYKTDSNEGRMYSMYAVYRQLPEKFGPMLAQLIENESGLAAVVVDFLREIDESLDTSSLQQLDEKNFFEFLDIKVSYQTGLCSIGKTKNFHIDQLKSSLKENQIIKISRASTAFLHLISLLEYLKEKDKLKNLKDEKQLELDIDEDLEESLAKYLQDVNLKLKGNKDKFILNFIRFRDVSSLLKKVNSKINLKTNKINRHSKSLSGKIIISL